MPAIRSETESDYDEEEGFIPIFVVRRTEGSPFFGSFPFGGSGFPFNFFGKHLQKGDNVKMLIVKI